MNFNLRKHTILLTVAGSRAYGMHTETSDVDVKGVCIPPKEHYLGYYGYQNRFEQADKTGQMDCFIDLLTAEEMSAVASTKVEGSVYELRKFLKLAAGCNPNTLDTLFCRDSEVRLTSEVGEKLRENAHLFLSKRARWTFSGYAFDQLKRIKSHKRWLMSPPTHKPTRQEFRLPDEHLLNKEQMMAAEAAIRKKLDGWEIDYGQLSEADKLYIHDQISTYLAELGITSNKKFAAAARSIGYDENLIHLLQREREFKVATTQWKQYQDWKRDRNPERAALEEKYGYDVKHGAHLVRLLRMCREILEEGKVNVWRDDADYLLSIRRGELSYDELIEFAQTEDKAMGELYKECTLPTSPDEKAINELCIEIVENAL